MNEIEKLMRPRYEVIADYPKSPFKVGEVFTPAIPSAFKSYPHLFREMEWWEGMAESEMPKYVKSEQWGRVFKVLSHFAGLHKEQCKVYDGKIDRRMRYENLLPATEAEYKGEGK